MDNRPDSRVRPIDEVVPRSRFTPTRSVSAAEPSVSWLRRRRFGGPFSRGVLRRPERAGPADVRHQNTRLETRFLVASDQRVAVSEPCSNQ